MTASKFLQIFYIYTFHFVCISCTVFAWLFWCINVNTDYVKYLYSGNTI